MGNVTSDADITITNVSVKILGLDATADDNSKSVLADGNYIYNGKFQEGEQHMGFWEFGNNTESKLYVTDFADGRRLKIEGSNITTDAPLTLSQTDLALGSGNYVFSVDIESEAGKTVNVKIGDASFDIVLEDGNKTYTNKLSLSGASSNKNVILTFGEAGDYLVDNVSLTEDSLIKNGSFNAGLAGFEPYAYTMDNVSWVVDSLTEDNAIDFTINNTGNEAWHIQLKQNGVELEEGQWYRLSLDAKSSKDRKLMFAIQRDGSKHNDDWTPYSGEKVVDLTGEYNTYTVEFMMDYETDLESVLSISMGAVDGTSISEQHRICIDNIMLEKIDAPADAE